MEVSSLGNFAAAQKQTTETKDARASSTSIQPQGTNTEEAQTSPIPPVNQTADAGGGNTVNPESSSGGSVDLLA